MKEMHGLEYFVLFFIQIIFLMAQFGQTNRQDIGLNGVKIRLSNMVHRTFRLSPARTLTVGFVILICIGTILLMLPFAVREGLQPLSWEDALFTSTSATCVTGLVVVDTITTFSTFGQVVIMLLVQIGGLGFMTFATIFALMMKKRISLRERLILQEAMNANSIESIVRLIRKVIFFSILIEASAALIFTFHWARDMPLHQSIYFGVFHAISLFNNGGFDLFGDFSSFKAFVDDPLFNVVSYMLIFAGSVGFVVLAELFDYKHMRRLSLHTEVVLTTSGILWIGGGIIIFVLEYTNPQTLGTLDLSGKIYASFFQSVATRSAGTSTLDIGALRHPIHHDHPHVHRCGSRFNRRRNQSHDLCRSHRLRHCYDSRTRGCRDVPLPPIQGINPTSLDHYLHCAVPRHYSVYRPIDDGEGLFHCNLVRDHLGRWHGRIFDGNDTRPHACGQDHPKRHHADWTSRTAYPCLCPWCPKCKKRIPTPGRQNDDRLILVVSLDERGHL